MHVSASGHVEQTVEVDALETALLYIPRPAPQLSEAIDLNVECIALWRRIRDGRYGALAARMGRVPDHHGVHFLP
jgi:hypothetical protein